MKSVFKTLAGSVAALALSTSIGMAASYQLNMNSSLTPDDPVFKGLERFKELVEEKTDGDVSVRVFPGSQLGSDEDILEQARAGANVGVVVDGGRLSEFAPELAILSAPYIVDNFTQMRKVVTSEMFDQWADKLANASGHRILSFNWYQGTRHLITNKEINSPADLSGVRLRTIGAPVFMETIRAMGATPTPMGWTEVYTAIQQRVIDAAEAQAPAVYGSKLHEVGTHYTKTGQFFLITGLVTGELWFNQLPAEYKVAVQDAALEAGDYASNLVEESLLEYEAKMNKESGMKIVEIDNTEFKQATEVVYEKLGLTELRDQVRAVIAE
ncbi:DctP family TRAP transporter solute-binding subunit [Rhodobacteraceae bacterium RKSG542]|uniref:C4-dicarboxylate TRAP transporter substrate-binding protein n=1 Tax=Pseudovibrio flavus TaxID=2529854 RepID=UPI0012BCDAB7|nr:C4-dicarboxylate TRAP transporter substrate-binding protein [Pseudovibrio flavus]MTI17676.1 DctP family TRAP transporter solute-binding subunit [Pseudovibrio flavus]